MNDTFRIRLGLVLACVLTTVSCSGLLDVSDPTLIRAGDIANAPGANAERLDAVNTLTNNMVGIVQDVAYVTDEWTYDLPVGVSVVGAISAQLDLRNSGVIESLQSDNHLGRLSQAFWHSSVALGAVRAFTPDSLRNDYLAQLYAIRGYLVLQMAEDICPGFPLNDVVDSHEVYGGPLTTDSAIAFASTQLDSALKYARDSTRFLRFAQIVKGRALLDKGDYTGAAATVADVQTTDLYAAEQNGRVVMPTRYCAGCAVTALGDREGGNGQPFVSAHDPRIPLLRLGPRRSDPSETLYITTKGYGDTDQLVFASGIEARLIQAEAALHNHQSWKPTLDSLRATVGLDTLVDPGNDSARVDMIYSERAFWLFMTGRRLGDMRRLIRNYGRGPETVFPTGTWRGGSGDAYGQATSIPFDFAAQQRYNPYITTGCTSR